jgi:hypothetical protein
MTNNVSNTRFHELGFTTYHGIWRIVAKDTGNVVGPIYKSKSELLADLPRYAADYGCELAATQKPASVPDWQTIARDLAAALDACSHQLHQVKGAFPGDEGIANALFDADEAIETFDLAHGGARGICPKCRESGFTWDTPREDGRCYECGGPVKP